MDVLRAEKEAMLFLAAPACCLPAQGSVLGTGGSLKVHRGLPASCKVGKKSRVKNRARQQPEIVLSHHLLFCSLTAGLPRQKELNPSPWHRYHPTLSGNASREAVAGDGAGQR